MTRTPIQAFSPPLDDRYEQLFRTFLKHTSQKSDTARTIAKLLDGLVARRLCVDVGAGIGVALKRFQGRFERYIALEPDPLRLDALRRACPWAEVRTTMIQNTRAIDEVDFLHCAHVHYRIPRIDWRATVERCLNWLADSGVAVFVPMS